MADNKLQSYLAVAGWFSPRNDDNDNDTTRSSPRFARFLSAWSFWPTSLEERLLKEKRQLLHTLDLEKTQKAAMADELARNKAELAKSKAELRQVLVENSFHGRRQHAEQCVAEYKEKIQEKDRLIRSFSVELSHARDELQRRPTRITQLERSRDSELPMHDVRASTSFQELQSQLQTITRERDEAVSRASASFQELTSKLQTITKERDETIASSQKLLAELLMTQEERDRAVQTSNALDAKLATVDERWRTDVAQFKDFVQKQHQAILDSETQSLRERLASYERQMANAATNHQELLASATLQLEASMEARISSAVEERMAVTVRQHQEEMAAVIKRSEAMVAEVTENGQASATQHEALMAERTSAAQKLEERLAEKDKALSDLQARVVVVETARDSLAEESAAHQRAMRDASESTAQVLAKLHERESELEELNLSFSEKAKHLDVAAEMIQGLQNDREKLDKYCDQLEQDLETAYSDLDIANERAEALREQRTHSIEEALSAMGLEEAQDVRRAIDLADENAELKMRLRDLEAPDALPPRARTLIRRLEGAFNIEQLDRRRAEETLHEANEEIKRLRRELDRLQEVDLGADDEDDSDIDDDRSGAQS